MKHFIISGTRHQNWIKCGVGFTNETHGACARMSEPCFCAVLQFVDFSRVPPLSAYMDQSYMPDISHNGPSLDATSQQGYSTVNQW